VFRFFHAIGVNLKQIYGQTETCGIAVMHADDDIRFQTVGKPVPATELRIAENGEILLRSPSVFQGYYGDEAATEAALDAEGWLHTDDVGYLDDSGHLVVIDRAKDVMQMQDGTRFSPAFIENKLKFSPYVEEAVVFWDPGPDVTAMLVIDPRATGAWAEGQRLSYTTYGDLASKAEVYDLLAEEVARANQDLPEAARVQRFVLLHKQLDADDDEVTHTRKVRRRIIAERYTPIIQALAERAEKVSVRTTITSYQDGTRVEREVTLRIRSMDGIVASSGRRVAFGAHR
jgi:long-chain acyl-CoA synthetase